MADQSNHLTNEKSPYLQQHASNPVDWYPWGDKAFRKAASEDRPIFLSIGYSTCHWCHVMEHESFEDKATADYLNAYFVCIKVDREERPDIDKIFMDVVVATGGRGGWPLNVFLTPEGKPIYGGTYFPKESRWGMPSLVDVAGSVLEAWTTQREKVLNSADDIVNKVINRRSASRKVSLSPALMTKAYESFAAAYDPAHGGFSRAPKFPSPHNLQFLLQYGKFNAESKAIEMTIKTLEEMYQGGLFDQLGGGFHRYSVDQLWRVPHFEKMIYDQAGLATVYTEAWLHTGNTLFSDAANRTLEYVRREMLSPEGLFYSAEDADSYTSHEKTEKKEGAFYLWSWDELANTLTPEEFRIIQSTYNINEKGNIEEDPHGEFAGMNILHTENSTQDALLESAKSKLLEIRKSRVRPHLDDKSLVNWNGMMISAFAKAACAFNNSKYAEIARKAAAYILTNLMDEENTLKHRYIHGEAAIDGMLQDYAFLAAALLDLYETDFEAVYLEQATQLADKMIELFRDDADGGFFSTAKPAVEFAARQKSAEDNATASASATATDVLFRLSRMLREPRYEQQAQDQIDSISARLNSVPIAFSSSLKAIGFTFGKPYEFILIEGENPEPARRIGKILKSKYLPNSVIVKRPYNMDNDSIEFKLMPWMQDMTPENNDVILHICERGCCRLPAEGEEVEAKALEDF